MNPFPFNEFGFLQETYRSRSGTIDGMKRLFDMTDRMLSCASDRDNPETLARLKGMTHELAKSMEDGFHEQLMCASFCSFYLGVSFKPVELTPESMKRLFALCRTMKELRKWLDDESFMGADTIKEYDGLSINNVFYYTPVDPDGK